MNWSINSLKWSLCFLSNRCTFKPLLPYLSFITNKKQWSGHIRGQAMRTIPEEDYGLIMKAAEAPRG